MATNRRILFVQRPVGPITDAIFETVTDAVPEPGEGEAVVKVEYLSLDPAMRGWMRDEPSYLPPIQIGEVMRSGGAGHVVASRNAALPVGSAVMGMLGWQDYAVVGGAGGGFANPIPEGTDLLDALGVFGSTGLTAYIGVVDIGKPEPGETVVVSGAAGGVGSVAGQIAKILGCRVVGTAGSREKCDYVVGELGFDACVDYKRGDFARELGAACPGGIDVYFDNVGGDVLDAALQHMADFGRIVACGMISRYNDAEPVPGPRWMTNIVTRRLRIQGFILLDHLDRLGEAARQLAEWKAQGRLQSRVHVVEGLDAAPKAITMLFTGENLGKLVVKV